MADLRNTIAHILEDKQHLVAIPAKSEKIKTLFCVSYIYQLLVSVSPELPTKRKKGIFLIVCFHQCAEFGSSVNRLAKSTLPFRVSLESFQILI